MTSKLLIYSAVISPHYGDTTDAGTPADQNERQHKTTHARNDGKNGNQPSQIDRRTGSRPKKRKADFEKMMAERQADQEKRKTECKVDREVATGLEAIHDKTDANQMRVEPETKLIKKRWKPRI
jgi:hypothetical protein